MKEQPHNKNDVTNDRTANLLFHNLYYWLLPKADKSCNSQKLASRQLKVYDRAGSLGWCSLANHRSSHLAWSGCTLEGKSKDIVMYFNYLLFMAASAVLIIFRMAKLLDFE